MAKFTCNQCGHICTPPAAINAIPHQMEQYGHERADADNALTLAALRAQHRGNDFSIRLLTKLQRDDVTGQEVEVSDKKEIRIARSYAKVVFQDQSALEESDHITLACPVCDAVLYDCVWRKR